MKIIVLTTMCWFLMFFTVFSQDSTGSRGVRKKKNTVINPPVSHSIKKTQKQNEKSSGSTIRQKQSARIPIADSVKIPILDFKNTDIRDILRAVGMQYNVNIYLEPDVTGNVSLYLVDIAAKDAVDFIIKRKGFDYKVENNIVKVFKPETPPPPKPKVVFHLKDSLLSVDFKELSVSEVIRLCIDSAHINVVLDGRSTKTVSSKLSRIHIQKAIKIIFESNGFDVTGSDGVYYISQQEWGDEKQKGGNTGTVRKSTRRMDISVSEDKKVSLEVTDAPIDDLVRNIALKSKLNIILYEKISGTITAKCDSSSIDDILRFVLQHTKYTFWKDKGIYFIGSREMSQQKTTTVVPLRHIRAEESEIAKLLPPKITQSSTLKFDPVHNSVIVIGSFDDVAKTQEFLENIDKPIPQVLIEALVVEFNLNKIRSYGISVFTGNTNDSLQDWQSEQFLPTLNLKPGQKRTALILNTVLKNLGVSRIVTLPKNFRSSIQALEVADVVKVHSTPQIATINGNAASITIGETRYYKLSKETKSAANSVNTNVIGTDERFIEKKFNTQLEVTPWVMADGYVMVKIQPEFNIPRSGGDVDRPPTIDTRVIKSMVRLRNGQTIVLGGQRQTENVVNSRGVPILSSIPILGWLFSSRTISKNETQMMIFLTPHVYYGDEVVVSPDDYFGDELNKMLEKHDPEAKKKARQRKREKRKKEKLERREKEKQEQLKIQEEKRQKEQKQISENNNKKNISDSTALPAINKEETERNDSGEKKRRKKSRGFLWFKRKQQQDTPAIEDEEKNLRTEIDTVEIE